MQSLGAVCERFPLKKEVRSGKRGISLVLRNGVLFPLPSAYAGLFCTISAGAFKCARRFDQVQQNGSLAPASAYQNSRNFFIGVFSTSLSYEKNITDDANGNLVEGVLESMAKSFGAELTQKIKRNL